MIKTAGKAVALAAVGMALQTMTAQAQVQSTNAAAYPIRPLRFVVPFPPGGSNDIIARMLAGKLAEEFGQQVVVDNRGGANGIIGTDLAAKSAPDGHTFIIVGNGFVNNVHMYRKLPYRVPQDFAPVSLVGNGSFVLVVHPGLPARSVGELITLAKSAPEKYTMASAGIGNMGHLTGELFMAMTGTRFVHVPYKGGGPAMTELLAGQVAIYFSTITVAIPHVKAGKLRALGVTGAQRAAVAPEVPTIAEGGVRGYAVDGWYGLLMPAATPTVLVERFATTLHRVLQNAELKQRLATQGIGVEKSTPAAFRKHLDDELVKWAKVIRDAGIQPE